MRNPVRPSGEEKGRIGVHMKEMESDEPNEKKGRRR
jgi:hypothetical protein